MNPAPRSSQKLKWLVITLLLVSCCIIVWRCRRWPVRGGQNGVLRIAWRTDVQSLDPAVASNDMFSAAVIRVVSEGLVDYDDEANLIPVLAESLPDVSPDGRVYRFRLRRDIRFSNGRAVVAEDVVYSLLRVLNPVTKSPGAGDLRLIRGAQAYQESGRGEAVVPGLRVVDRHTIDIELEEPNFAFLHILTRVYNRVVPREEVEAHGEDFSSHPVGTGPFVLVEWTRGAKIRLKRNPDYHGPEQPKLDFIEIVIGGDEVTHQMMFERGELDLLFAIPTADFARVRSDPKLALLVASGPQNATGFLNLNCEMPPFSDVRVRRAISYGVDRDRLVRLLNGRAIPARGILPPLMPGRNPNLPDQRHDLLEARRLLTEAGYPDGFATTLWTTGDFPHGLKIAQAVQQDLDEVGIRAELRDVSEGTLLKSLMQRKTVPFSVLGWSQAYPDPSNFFEPNFQSDRISDVNGTNVCYYSRADVNDMLRLAAREPVRASRMKLYRDIEQRIMEDVPWVVLFHPITYQLCQPWVQGFRLHPVWLAQFEKLSTQRVP